MSVQTEIRDGLKELEVMMGAGRGAVGQDDGPRFITWHNVQIPVTVSTIRRGVTWILSGAEVTIGLTLIIRGSYFVNAASTLPASSEDILASNVSPLPAAGKLINFEGFLYRVVRVSSDPTLSYVALDLEDRNR